MCAQCKYKVNVRYGITVLVRLFFFVLMYFSSERIVTCLSIRK